ncbi:MAG: hypothetical protein ACPKM0_05440 [Pleomorphochaeta sp.]
MYYSIHEIEIMTKSHSEEIIRSCSACKIKKDNKRLFTKLINSILVIKHLNEPKN